MASIASQKTGLKTYNLELHGVRVNLTIINLQQKQFKHLLIINLKTLVS